VLERDTRDDDCKPLIDVILQLKGVLSVSTQVTDVVSLMALERARRELGEKVIAIIYPKASP
jgi:hypothetical protein